MATGSLEAFQVDSEEILGQEDSNEVGRLSKSARYENLGQLEVCNLLFGGALQYGGRYIRGGLATVRPWSTVMQGCHILWLS